MTDDVLLAQAERLAAGSRSSTADLVAHLAEIESRGLHLQQGYSSLFQYCRQALGLAEYSAYNRIEAARAARRFPVILDLLKGGDVHLATVRILAPHLTAENHVWALAEARGKTKVQVEEIAARIAPRPEMPDFVRRLPDRGPTYPPAPVPPPLSAGVSVPVVPLGPGRHRLQATVDTATVEMLQMAQDLMRHALPSGDVGVVVGRALTGLVKSLLREKFAVTERPQKAGAPDPDARYVTAEVKRVVWLRDRGRCAYVGPNGHRCGARGYLEFHHVKPWMAGGETTADNIELRCRNHNQYEGRTYFARPAGEVATCPGASGHTGAAAGNGVPQNGARKNGGAGKPAGGKAAEAGPEGGMPEAGEPEVGEPEARRPGARTREAGVLRPGAAGPERGGG